ncbi:protein phosphatase 1 regulatory subunit 21 [Episyrphus balteatus]|uniref:protein phosphatase 1 regulatory subunit 21 n=1 Tax=Episyrphus balteatus TaxID=286459 RepID=UPI0024852EAD|nr:protein phosphatase 1 regulatory subunit 21 [Episyrphus balteatus]
MENNNTLEAKYRKLASEYSKLRAQASVLKTAVIEEQTKSSTLRETLRQKETSLRRSEHEVDSLGFRNKQLERRVASLQEDIASKENRKSNKNQKSDATNNGKTKSSSSAGGGSGAGQDTTGSRFADYFDNTQEVLIFEELQKKILENAELTSSIDDKNQELQMHAERIYDLEKQLEKRTTENMEIERRLRKEIDSLQARISELETKLVEAASMIGSEDALSASGSDNTTPLHTTTNSSTTSEDRIAYLEKEVSHWRTQYEISRISDSLPHEMSRLCKEKQQHQYNGPLVVPGSCCSTAATGLSVIAANAAAAGSDNNKGLQNDNNLTTTATTTIKEQLIFNNFSKKFEDLLKTKCMSESRLASYQVEADHLHNCLENSTQELKDKETELLIAGQTIQTLEEDLATTRVNYEEQISVLTEQVISLSEQLASCK